MLKRIVTIQDVSCFGKCSLTVALPLISAMGVETAVIPTAVLSTHTGCGFSGYTFHDLTTDIPEISNHWKNLNLTFDGIYTGYLGSAEQVRIVSDFFDAFRGTDTKIIVDPVLGDAGKLYAGFTRDFAYEMRRLCRKADVIAPNLTETALLLGIDYPTVYTLKDIYAYLRQLTALGCHIAVITGVQCDETHHGAVAYDSEADQFYSTYREHVPEPMHGTGDIFASVLSGALIRGASIEQALYIAVNFTADTIMATIPDLRTLPREESPWYGVEFEACIDKLVGYTKSIDDNVTRRGL